MSVKERLKAYIDYRGLSIRAFESQVGLGNGYVNNISKSISLEKLHKIKSEFPDLNLSWLTLGDGEMTLENIKDFVEADAEGKIRPARTKDLMDVMERTFKLFYTENRDARLTKGILKGLQLMITDWAGNPNPSAKNIAERFLALNPEINREWLLTGIGGYLNPEAIKKRRPVLEVTSLDQYQLTAYKKVGTTEISQVKADGFIVTTPLVGASMYNDFLQKFTDLDFLTSLPRHSVMFKDGAIADYLSFEIANDEMLDENGDGYAAGNVITCRLISLNDLGIEPPSKIAKSMSLPIHLSPNNDLVIVFDASLMIRQARFHDKESKTILLSSLNRDKLLYPDRIVRLEDVKAIYQIVGKSDK